MYTSFFLNSYALSIKSFLLISVVFNISVTLKYSSWNVRNYDESGGKPIKMAGACHRSRGTLQVGEASVQSKALTFLEYAAIMIKERFITSGIPNISYKAGPENYN